jgi:UDP:flavonoid glycosyltransferase YjiC (YdhE family)
MKPGYKEERFIYSGPLLHYNHLNTPKWYNETKELDGNFIYLSMGSSSLTLYPLLLKKLARIYGDKPNIYIITNTTYIISAKQKRPQLPSNFFITNMASAEVMLSLADITICHGGKGTIYHSILNGVPLLGIPQQAEQEMNLIRIKELGLGDYLLSKEFLEISDADLKNRIDYVLYNKEIQKNVLNFSSKIRNCMGDLDDIVRKIHIKINQ